MTLKLKLKLAAAAIGIGLGIVAGTIAACAQELRAFGSMLVTKDGSSLVIRVPYHEPRLSGSGKHQTIASERTTVQLDGRAVIVQVTAYTPEAK